MKPRRSLTSRGVQPLCRFLPVVLLLSLSVRLSGASKAAATAKPYLLFMGANLSVQWQGKLWPVQGVKRGAFVIDVEGRPVIVRDTDLRMKIDSMLKMTTAVADVTDLQTARAYTAANDPRGKAEASMMLANAGSDNLDLAGANMNSAQSASARDASEPKGPDFPMGPTMQLQAQATAATQAFQQTLSDQGSEMSDVGAAMSREQDALNRKLFDALSLSFKVSAARPVENPYLVVIVRFRDKADDPKTTRMMVYGQVLPSIGKRAQTVRLFRGGFPRGYRLESCQVHLYDRGNEIGTNAAPEHVAMSRDEAFQFSMANYVVRNRGKTLPPAPATDFWPRDMATRLPEATRGRALFIKVGKNGRAGGFYGDKACTRPISDAGLDLVRSELRFDPALKKGTPVDGVVAVKLGRIGG